MGWFQFLFRVKVLRSICNNVVHNGAVMMFNSLSWCSSGFFIYVPHFVSVMPGSVQHITGQPPIQEKHLLPGFVVKELVLKVIAIKIFWCVLYLRTSGKSWFLRELMWAVANLYFEMKLKIGLWIISNVIRVKITHKKQTCLNLITFTASEDITFENFQLPNCYCSLTILSPMLRSILYIPSYHFLKV